MRKTAKTAFIIIATLILISTIQATTQPNTQQNTPNPPTENQPKTNPAPPPTPIKEWDYTTGSAVYSSPCVADVDGDDQLEVLVGSLDKKVYCLNRTGGKEWSYTTGDAVYSSPCVADVDGDGQLEVLIGSWDHKVYCLNRTGGLEWSYTTGDNVRSSPCVVDVDGDGQLEVLVGSWDNKVYCLSRTGGLEWSYTTGYYVYSSPCVADVDGDGQLEVLVGSSSDNKVYCLSRTGGLEWSYTTWGYVVSSPCVADVDGDGQLEVLVGSLNNVYCLSRTGGLEWSCATGSYVYSSPCVADVDGDGQLEVLAGSYDNKVYCLNRTGGKEWSYTTGDAVSSSPCVADVDGDGQLEVLVGSDDNKVYCLSVVGAPFNVGACPWPSIGFRGDVRHSGVFTDADGDGLTDAYEVTAGTDPNDPDSDQDGNTDYQEFLLSTIPRTGAEWTYLIAGASSPAVADVNDDGKLEAVVGSTDHNVYCLNATGEPVWNYATGGQIRCAPALADINGDGKLETIVGTWDDHKVYCLNATGKKLWEYTTGNTVDSSPAVADINGDSKLEVLIGSYDNKVYCLNATGKLVWSYATSSWIRSSPAIADINGDSKLEVVVGSYDNNVYCLNATGKVNWTYTTNGQVFSVPTIGDVNLDGKLEVVVGSKDRNVYCLNGKDGTKIWNYTTGDYTIYPCVADITGDGKMEVLIGSYDNKVYCLNSSGKLVWSYLTGGDVWPCPAVADVEGDRQVEVVVGSLDNKTYCLNRTGGVEWTYRTGGAVSSSQAVVDFDKDGQLEVLVGSSDGIYCLSVCGAPYASGEVYPWPSICFHGDIQHSGCYADSDHDELTDTYEVTAGSDPQKVDADTDGLTDYQEFQVSTNPLLDEVPPAAITDLDTASQTVDSITLTWTAQGDNSGSGTATGYAVKYSTSGQITELNWNSAATFVQYWTPLAAGSAETHIVSGLSEDTTYWFAVKAYDKITNYGAISNSPSRKTSDVTPPATIANLLATGIAGTIMIRLNWTAPGDNGDTGVASGYVVKYSTVGPITSGSWGSATTYAQSWVPRGAGQTETHVIYGLSNDTWYWFAVEAYDEVPNYGSISNSPSVKTADLFPPAAITDLATSNPTATTITLTWTASGDNGTLGTAKWYNVRYSLDGPINSYNPGMSYGQSWVPLPAGSTETHVITNLYSDARYWFLVMAVDEAHNNGRPSNCPSERTLDGIPPAAIMSLYAGVPATNTTITLAWIAVGDNYLTGTATGYVVKYSTMGPINASNWDSATTYNQNWTPLPAGEIETRVVSGLSFDVIYWFAVKAYDDVSPPNFGDISNSPSGSTDVVPPAAITDLATGSSTANTICLTWTAPGDNGNTGTAYGYVVKYSTVGPITSGKWYVAEEYYPSQYWVPRSVGQTENQVITGLRNDTRYWFAVEAYDEVLFPNYGNVSNSPSGKTADAFPPAAITDLATSSSTATTITLTWTAPGDNGTLGTATGYIVKYSTSGPINADNWGLATYFTQSWTPLPAGSSESHLLSGFTPGTTYWFAVRAYDDVFNYGRASNSASTTTLTVLNVRTRDWSGGILPSCTVDLSGVGSVTSDSNGWANFTGVPCGTHAMSVRWFGGKVNQTYVTVSGPGATISVRCHVWDLTINANNNLGTPLHPNNMQIYVTFPNGTHVNPSNMNSLTWKVQNGTYYFAVKWQGNWVYGNTSTLLDITQTQNLPCKVYSLSFTFRDNSGGSTINPTNWGIRAPNGTICTVSGSIAQAQNGTWELVSVNWQGSNVVPSTLRTFDAAIGTPSFNCRVYQLSFTFRDNGGTPLYKSPSQITLLCPNASSVVLTSYSNILTQNGSYRVTSVTWNEINVLPSPSDFSLTSSGSQDVGCLVYNLRIRVVDDLGASIEGATVSVTLPNGTIVSALTGADGFANFPQCPCGSFTGNATYQTGTISIAGDVSSTYSFTIDLVQPAAITDLTATSTSSTSITLTWTAPGDAGMIGNATGYVVKYSTSGEITDANWDSATTYTQSWMPVKNGTTETRVIYGLTSGTRYWFAIKAYDEVSNYSLLSNCENATTTSQGGGGSGGGGNGGGQGGLPITTIALVSVIAVVAVGVVIAVVKMKKK